MGFLEPFLSHFLRIGLRIGMHHPFKEHLINRSQRAGICNVRLGARELELLWALITSPRLQNVRNLKDFEGKDFERKDCLTNRGHPFKDVHPFFERFFTDYKSMSHTHV